MTRIKEKIDDLSAFLEEIGEIVPLRLEAYKSNKTVKAACERYLEKIVECITDIAFLVIKLKKLKLPEDDIDAFEILMENRILSAGLSNKLKLAKGMRNIIAHEYGKIDDNIVFEAIKDELIVDSKNFIKEINKNLK